MTREEAKQVVVYAYQELPLPKFLEVINEIYNDHEAQLKAKDEEIERLKVQLINAFNDTGIPKYRVKEQQ